MISDGMSVVVAGPLKSRLGGRSSQTFLDNLREAFPAGQIVISTWSGEINGLALHDFTVVEDTDPGIDQDWATHPNASNYTRMVRSACNGLAAATHPFVLKTRCEVTIPPGAQQRLIELLQGQRNRELLVSNWWTLRCSDGPALHISDILQFGRTIEVQSLWTAAEERRSHALRIRSRSNPAANEQLLWSSYAVAKELLPDVLHSCDQVSPAIHRAWRMLLRTNARVFAPESIGIESKWGSVAHRRAPDGYLRGNRLFVDLVVDAMIPPARSVRHQFRMLRHP